MIRTDKNHWNSRHCSRTRRRNKRSQGAGTEAYVKTRNEEEKERGSQAKLKYSARVRRARAGRRGKSASLHKAAWSLRIEHRFQPTSSPPCGLASSLLLGFLLCIPLCAILTCLHPRGEEASRECFLDKPRTMPGLVVSCREVNSKASSGDRLSPQALAIWRTCKFLSSSFKARPDSLGSLCC